MQLVATIDRAAVGELLRLPEFIDLAIPRGGEGLIRRVTAEAKMPVLKHYQGNCHVYVDARCDVDRSAAAAEVQALRLLQGGLRRTRKLHLAVRCAIASAPSADPAPAAAAPVTAGPGSADRRSPRRRAALPPSFPQQRITATAPSVHRWRRAASVIFFTAIIASVGIRAYRDLSRPDSWSYLKDLCVSPSLTSSACLT